MKKLYGFMLVAMMAASLGLAGCSGDDGSAGASGLSAYEIAVNNGFTGTEQEWLASLDPTNPTTAAANVQPESCSVCHNGTAARNGDAHQAAYADLFQEGIVQVSALAYANDGTNDTLTFNMTKNGAAFDCTGPTVGSLNIGYSQYDSATRAFTAPSGSRINLKGTVTYLGAGVCQSVKAQTTLGDLSALNGTIAVYGEDELVTTEPAGSHLQLAKYPFAALLNLGTVDYASAANVTGCEKCHQKPYYKHGYIIGDASLGGGQDFYTCKVCHVDNGAGGHTDWQYSVDDPQGWANGDPLTALQTARYAYKTRLMNDVHMSHAMEFPYPMSMRNCATCHEGKLAQTISPANFTIETCKSCHPLTGGTDLANASGNFAVDTRPMALETIWTNVGLLALHETNGVPTTTACASCHTGTGVGGAKAFNEFHTGYDPKIYDAAGNKYATDITASVDSVTLTGNVLDITFSATTGTVDGLDAATLVPTVMVSFYGYDTKDFLVSNHSRDTNNNRMEFTLGAADNALFTTVANTPGAWEVQLDLAAYGATPTLPEMIAAGTIKRAEVAVLPNLKNADGVTVGLDAPSVTFNLTTNAVETDYVGSGVNAIVSVDGTGTTLKGCNSCHDQLATTFHSGDRGGNIVVCRMCHVVTSGGSHLEGQSRSIDSYVHAIHSFQAFDVDNVDFTDPVEAKLYEEHVGFLFPDFATINCMACHNAGKFNVPDQSKSMPGVLSGTDEVPGMAIAASPAVVVGPAARACGACHRAEAIREDEPGELAAINSHTAGFGYRIENTTGVLDTVIATIMGLFQ